MKLFCKISLLIFFWFSLTGTCFANDSTNTTGDDNTTTGYSIQNEDGIEEVHVIGQRVISQKVAQYINNCDSNKNSSFCACLLQKSEKAALNTASQWISECSPDKPTPLPTVAATPPAENSAEPERKVASSTNSGGLSCNSPTLNSHCSMPSQDSSTVTSDSEDTINNANEEASDDAAPIVDDLAGAGPDDNAQFACRESLEHEKNGAEFVCENPVKALGGPAAQAVRTIGQYGAPIAGAGGLLMKDNGSINKLCTTIAMLSATGVGIGVAARKKCNGKIKKCQQTCETEKTQICTAYQTVRAKCLSVQTRMYTAPALAPTLQKLQEKIRIYQQKVEEIENIKRRCKKLEANIASMGQDILNLVMTLGSAKVCRDATGGKYTSDIDNCEERGGQVVSDPLGNMICDEPEQKCTTTAECPDNEMCMNGVCRAITGMCRDGSLKNCSENCEDGEPPSNCPTTGTCSDGSTQTCSENCSDGSKPQGCESNESDTGTCSDGSTQTCSENCPDGQPPANCTANSDVCPDSSLTYPNCNCNCPEGQFCNSEEQCTENNNDGKGDCPDGSQVACDQDCSDGSRPTNCRSCNSDSDCEENQICNRGVCVSEDPVLIQDGAGGGGAPTDDMESEMAITNDGMGGGSGKQRELSSDPLSAGMGLPNTEEFERSGGTDGASGATDSSASGGGGFFSGLFGRGRKGKSKGKVTDIDENGATIKGSGGGGFGGYGGGGRRGRGKLALSKKQIKKLTKEKGAQRTLSKMKEGFGGAHHDIFERITKRFTHLCKNKMNCR